jgi:hypothetical protein
MQSEVFHGHGMLVTKERRYIVVGDDGTIETRFGDALYQNENPFALFNTNNMVMAQKIEKNFGIKHLMFEAA